MLISGSSSASRINTASDTGPSLGLSCPENRKPATGTVHCRHALSCSSMRRQPFVNRRLALEHARLECRLQRLSRNRFADGGPIEQWAMPCLAAVAVMLEGDRQAKG